MLPAMNSTSAEPCRCHAELCRVPWPESRTFLHLPPAERRRGRCWSTVWVPPACAPGPDTPAPSSPKFVGRQHAALRLPDHHRRRAGHPDHGGDPRDPRAGRVHGARQRRRPGGQPAHRLGRRGRPGTVAARPHRVRDGRGRRSVVASPSARSGSGTPDSPRRCSAAPSTAPARRSPTGSRRRVRCSIRRAGALVYLYVPSSTRPPTRSAGSRTNGSAQLEEVDAAVTELRRRPAPQRGPAGDRRSRHARRAGPLPHAVRFRAGAGRRHPVRRGGPALSAAALRAGCLPRSTAHCVLERWRAAEGGRSWIASRAEAIDAGWFGTDVAPRRGAADRRHSGRRAQGRRVLRLAIGHARRRRTWSGSTARSPARNWACRCCGSARTPIAGSSSGRAPKTISSQLGMVARPFLVLRGCPGSGAAGTVGNSPSSDSSKVGSGVPTRWMPPELGRIGSSSSANAAASRSPLRRRSASRRSAV